LRDAPTTSKAERSVKMTQNLNSTGLKNLGLGELGERMGMEITEYSVKRCVGTLPVAGNTQPFGLMHGGAYVVLGESLGSMAANLHAGPGRYAVGLDINATHTGSATTGIVTGVCTPIHLGRSVAVHEIVITDENGRRCSTIRITNMIMDRPKA
jgi:1,4-dihydroxy-2-naphthoyl-CoA hydrolase